MKIIKIKWKYSEALFKIFLSLFYTQLVFWLWIIPEFLVSVVSTVTKWNVIKCMMFIKEILRNILDKIKLRSVFEYKICLMKKWKNCHNLNLARKNLRNIQGASLNRNLRLSLALGDFCSNLILFIYLFIY